MINSVQIAQKIQQNPTFVLFSLKFKNRRNQYFSLKINSKLEKIEHKIWHK